MILTIKDVSQRLNLPIETVHRWIRQGKIPMQSNHGNYSIRSEMLERWAAEHQLGCHAEPQAGAMDEPDFDGILPAIQRGGVYYRIGGKDRDAVLKSAVTLLPQIESKDHDLIYNALVEREQLASTGIGHGIALPHPRTNPGIALSLPQITICFLLHPVDFQAIDDRPVSVLMLLLSPTTKQHVTMLSKLSYYLRNRNFREIVLAQPVQSDIFDAIAKLESKGK